MSDPTSITPGPVPPAANKQAIVFFDAQNLYFSAQEAFRVREPNFDPVLLAQHICGERGWEVKQVRFYTGVPGASQQPRWHRYWTAKLGRLRKREVPPGTVLSVQVGEEKGVDVRFALDCIRATIEGAFDVGVLFTQDQHHAEAVREAKTIAKSQNRTIELFSVYPEGCLNARGVNGTTWVQISEAVYSACIDTRNYFGS